MGVSNKLSILLLCPSGSYLHRSSNDKFSSGKWHLLALQELFLCELVSISCNEDPLILCKLKLYFPLQDCLGFCSSFWVSLILFVQYTHWHTPDIQEDNRKGCTSPGALFKNKQTHTKPSFLFLFFFFLEKALKCNSHSFILFKYFIAYV